MRKIFPDAVAAAKNVTKLHGCTYAWPSFMILLKRHFNIHIRSGLALEMGKYFTKRISVENIIERAGSHCPIVRDEREVVGSRIVGMLQH